MSDIIQQKTLDSIYSSLDLKDYTKHKRMAERTDLYSLYIDTNEKKAIRADKCGNFMVFSQYRSQDTTKVKNKLEMANFCKNRFCPFCAFLKSRKLVVEFKNILQQIEQNSKSKVTYLFLTLTIKNCPLNELRETLNKMSKAFNNMFKKEKLLDRHILGYLRAVEFFGDNTPKGEAHPHFHTLLVVDSSYFMGKYYISKFKWADMWRKYLGIPKNEPCIVDIRRIKAKNTEWLETDSAVFEVIKYSVAPAVLWNLTKDEFLELDKQVKGIRQYNRGGLCKTIKPLENEEEDLTAWEFLREVYLSWFDIGFFAYYGVDSVSNQKHDKKYFSNLARLLNYSPRKKFSG